MLKKSFYNLIFINKALAISFNELNPLRAGDIPTLINQIVGFLAWYIAPPIAALMFIYGAFQILTAGGNPEKITTGKHTIVYTAVAYGVILISLGLTSIIRDILGTR